MKFPEHFVDDIRDRVAVSEVVARRVSLKKAGREWKGLSPFNKERTPSFYVNDQKRAWFDFSSSQNGDIFDFVMKMDGLSFPQAVEHLAELAGLSLPENTAVKERTPEERERFEQMKLERETEHEERAAARQQEDERTEENMRSAAAKIWSESKALAGTVGEKYLVGRGIHVPPMGWPDVLRTHERLRHPSGRTLPALVARVDDLSGDLCAVWRIFLNPQGGKADVEDVKLGLGPASGGAVRLGGVAGKIGVGEGIESSLGAWELLRHRKPVWATLSASGMQNFEAPVGVSSVEIFPDGDKPKMRPDGELADDPTPAGRRAARALRGRMLQAGLGCSLAVEPSMGMDYLDVLRCTTLMLGLGGVTA